MEMLPQNVVDKGEFLALLQRRLELDTKVFEEKKARMSETERAQKQLELSKLECMIASLEMSSSTTTHLDKLVQDFAFWDGNKTNEMINFLLTEFFSTKYADGGWNPEFISDLVFEITRVMNFIGKLESNKKAKS